MNNVVHTRCCIAGGGPAGMMSALLLARIGVDVFVLEKHADFLRDFRGDTIHPSTLEIMHELGVLDEFLKRPHQEVREIAGQVGQDTVTIGDFTYLPTRCHFLALMPQWDFLNFVVEQARRYPTFHLTMQAEVTDLIVEQGVVVGAQAKTPDGNLEIRASLTIGADGRHSVIRRRAGLEVKNLGAPMDVMWMRISRHPNDPVQTFGHIDRGRILVLINREDYWQCAFVIPKGAADEIRHRGLSSFREEVTSLAPFLSDRVQELHDWKDISVLTVAVDRLVQWSRAGVLCIGDAAHAMSPIGGVGINLAIQDAVATANLLGEKLLHGTPSEEELQIVQRPRRFPTWATQQIQITIQNRAIGRVLGRPRSLTLPWQLKLLRRWPILRRIPARLVGIGVRPEHVKTPEVTTIRETTVA
ncbi:MAG TPA: FAD-dependent oxidoreductase [Terriglobales bacterium]|jgi:2-polyprenyl-6-methoxyphenol hydroxylase-like FAD-dependent oxidoreductase|nr:FAD-dependent oxidoreductase [Terriglobales bacterium]